MDNKDIEIIRQYPELFDEERMKNHSIILFGFELGKGWKDLILNSLPELSKIVKEREIKDFSISQIKEKFGGLRIYYSPRDEEVQNFVEKLENKCDKTCEICGADNAVIRNGGWVRTLCDNCQEERIK